ncbi:hypothetical protein SLOPH_835 [Spraguea lophii 42_110]|uniref:Uncharacterized protein n=1 Tax=Spraguea lophii (strain 42_110) TaxID=1358809 RepID=S7WBY3_SPRLO|nr:hypothetical protein SLOPH_835 [Spraguea lophii 42_110]
MLFFLSLTQAMKYAFVTNTVKIVNSVNDIIVFDSDMVDDALLGEESSKFRKIAVETLRKKLVGKKLQHLVESDFKDVLDVRADKNVFINKMYNYIISKFIYDKEEEKNMKNNKKAIVKFLTITYDHFVDKKNKRYEELGLFLGNAFHNTSYLKVMLNKSNQQVEESKGVNQCRGLLQITGDAYKTANNYGGSTDFLKNPEKMAYLEEDSIKATLFFYNVITKEIRDRNKNLTFEKLLKALNPIEVQGENSKQEQFKKLIAKRKAICVEVCTVLEYYNDQ